MKQSKGRIKNIETNTVNLDFGTYGLTVLESSRISAAQLEAVRRVLSRKMKRMGKIFFRVTADRGVSGKPAEVRMGKGKGSVDYYACYVPAGRILLEIDGISNDIAMEALRSCSFKLPCKTRIIQLPQIVA
jgi:large subunit ribosomal protein L16